MELELSSGLSSLLIMLGLLRISLKVSSLLTSFLNDFFLTLDGFFGTLGGSAARDLLEGLEGTLSGVGRGAGRLFMEGEAESLDWEELMAPIMDGIRKVLDDVRMDGGYAFIFDVAAGSFIVSADKNLDITERVLSKMRLAAPKAAPAAGAAKPAGPASAPAGVTTKKPPVE